MKTGYSVVLSLGLSGLVILLFIILNMFEGARGIMTTFLLASNLPGAYGQAYIGMFACIFILVLALSRNSIVFRPVVWVVPILNFLYGLLPMTWELRKTFNSAYDLGIGGGHGGWREVSAYTSMGLGTAVTYLMVSTVYTMAAIILIVFARKIIHSRNHARLTGKAGSE